MKIMISYQVDTVEEAKGVMAAVENRGKLTTFRVQDEPDEIYGAVELLRAVGVPATSAIPAAVPRANVNPGAPLIAKIGTGTLELILSSLAEGQQMPLPKYEQHLKLLWSRGKVKFDGSEYYL